MIKECLSLPRAAPASSEVGTSPPALEFERSLRDPLRRMLDMEQPSLNVRVTKIQSASIRSHV